MSNESTDMNEYYEALLATSARLGELSGVEHHDVVAVLGSGLGGYPATLTGAVEIDYSDLPGFPEPAVSGHAGKAYSLTMGDNRVLLLAGRSHAYEGYAMNQITFAVRCAVLSGCSKVVLTNASGGCGDGMEAGDLCLLTDHINLAGLSPLGGPNDERLGTRFPDMSTVYPVALRDQAKAAAAEAGVALSEGVYAWWRGPNFETPAEVQMSKLIGASMVGMSTVPEAVAANHMGAEVLGISLITNLAAGISENPLSGEEVMETAAEAAGRFNALFDALLPTL